MTRATHPSVNRPSTTGNIPKLSPASLCSLAIALWGWHTGLIFVAVAIIAVLEARHIVKQRWEISLSDLKEAAKLCVALVAILAVVLITVKKSVFIYSLLQWLPVAGVPLLIAQTYGLEVQTLLSQRFSRSHKFYHDNTRSKVSRQVARRASIDLYTLYFGTCIVAASAADSDHFFFYAGAAALTALFLWPLRPQRTSPVLWCLLFCLSVGLGFAGHRQLTYAQRQLEARVYAMIGDIASGGAVDPDAAATQMGSVGRLKLSNKIAFRVKTGDVDNAAESSAFPLLLQEASYNSYSLSTWSATNSLFYDVPPGEEDGDWILGAASEQETTITISDDLARGDGVLTLPHGVSRIQNLPVEEMQRNQFGAVQVDAKGDAAYQVSFSLGERVDGVGASEAIPTAEDLQIPNADRAAIATTLTQLSIDEIQKADISKQEIINRIAAYFQSFEYSLDLIRPDPAVTAVSDFLLNTQAGHCEYFASATALLLRGAGIPARYAIGYAVHEFSPLEGQYIVRNRDAHAWTLYYLDGRWQILDTTPPDWTAQEREMRSSFQKIPDFFDFLGFQVSYWMRQLGELGLREVLMIVIPLFFYLLWRSIQVFQGQQKSTSEELDSETLSVQRNGLDSELYDIEAQLRSQDLQRLQAESFLQWCNRVQCSLSETQFRLLKEILALHYRYRFDTSGLDTTERTRLTALSKQWQQEENYVGKHVQQQGTMNV